MSGRRWLVGAGLQHQRALAVERDGGIALQQPGDGRRPRRPASRSAAVPSPRTSASMSARVATSEASSSAVASWLTQAEASVTAGRKVESTPSRGGSSQLVLPELGPRLDCDQQLVTGPAAQVAAVEPADPGEVAPAAGRPLGDGHHRQVGQHVADRAVELAARRSRQAATAWAAPGPALEPAGLLDAPPRCRDRGLAVAAAQLVALGLRPVQAPAASSSGRGESHGSARWATSAAA